MRFLRIGTLSGRRLTVVCCALAVAGVSALPAWAAKDDLDLVSRATGGAAADESSLGPAVSGRGDVVAFQSFADNLSAEDDNAFPNIFVRDPQAGTTTLASRASGLGGAGANDGSSSPALSSDGHLVAFLSNADNLSAEDINTVSNVFVRDLQAGTTTLASRVSGPAGAGANDSAFNLDLSDDGRVVAFDSTADNLAPDDDNTFLNIFVRDLASNTTTLVSRATGFSGVAADAASFRPAVSIDGRFVAFYSSADNLSADDNNTFLNVFVRDLQLGTTTLASRAPGLGGPGADGNSSSPALSSDGRFVAFHSDADNLSADDNNAFTNVFVRDLQLGTTTLVSRAPGLGGPGADGDAGGASISAEGRIVAFISSADNLSPDDDNAFLNVFVRDLQAGATTLVNRAPGSAGAGADGSSDTAALSLDGRFVAFESLADNLSADDNDMFQNIYRRDVRGAPIPPTVPAPPAAAQARCDGRVATIVGTSGPDVLQGTGGPDVIASLGGNDLVHGGAGNDRICLGAGNDRGIGGSGSDRIFGESGRDILSGGSGNDRLAGGSSNDTLIGHAGRDVLLGGIGHDVARGGPGNDRIEGGTGSDRLFGDAGADRLLGQSGNDRMVGGSGNDILIGHSGRDVLIGGQGRDLARGGAGSDTLSGGVGDDRLFGDAGNDRVFGNAGRDRLVGGSGVDRAAGGPGSDSCAAEVQVSC